MFFSHDKYNILFKDRNMFHKNCAKTPEVISTVYNFKYQKGNVHYITY